MYNTYPDLMNPRKWKRTTFKQHDAFICMPPIGTKLYNVNSSREERTDSINRFVICYANLIQHTIDLEYFVNNYAFPHQWATREAIHNNTRDELMDWQQVQSINFNTDYMAIKVPITYKNIYANNLIVNREGLDHGEGDYVVCQACCAEEIDLRRAFVVNGLLFPLLFNMKPIGLSFKMKRYLDSIEAAKKKPKQLFIRK